MGQELFQHNNVMGPHVHTIVNWKYVNTLARTTDYTLTFRDLGKVCKDMEDGNYYVLDSIGALFVPNWVQINTPGGAGEANTMSSVGGGTQIFQAKVGINFPMKSLSGTANRITITDVSGLLTFNISENFQLAWSHVTGKPTTLSGYGITDAMPSDTTFSFLSLSDTPVAYTGQAGKVPRVNAGAAGLEFFDLPAASTTFISLTDTPVDYIAAAGQGVKVNALGTGLEFYPIPLPITTFISLTDTPANYTGAAGKIAKVRLDESGIEFIPDTVKNVVTTGSISGVLDLSSITAETVLVTLTENITSIIFPAGILDIKLTLLLRFLQDGTGGRTVNLSGVTFIGTPAVVDPTAAAVSYIELLNVHNLGWESYSQ